MTIGFLASWKVKDAQKQVAERAKAHSREIDRRIKEDSKSFWRKSDILVMGSSFFSTLCPDCVQNRLSFTSYSECTNKYCL